MPAPPRDARIRMHNRPCASPRVRVPVRESLCASPCVRAPRVRAPVCEREALQLGLATLKETYLLGFLQQKKFIV